MTGGSTGVYSAKTRPREGHVQFSGPAGYVGPIPDGADADAKTHTLRTGVDVPLAIERLSRDVYQDEDSAPRETMANEMRSASIAAAEHGASPIIRVVANADTREFSVHGIDTMGCTWDAFTKSLAVIGCTTNRDSGRPGQMGMGFYSNTLLSDTILFDSHSRETGERFTAMCKGGTEWQLGLPSAPMPMFGARVSMTVRDTVGMGMIKSMVRKCAGMAPCPVHMLDEDGTWTELPMFSSAKSLARYVLYNKLRSSPSHGGPSPLPADFASAMRSEHTGGKIDGVLYLHGEKDGVEACAAFATKFETVRVGERRVRARVIDCDSSKVVASLVGMPIGLKCPYDGAFRAARVIAVSVSDERRYRPTADRERFTSDAAEEICKKIGEILAGQLAAVQWPSTLAEHLRSPYRAALDAAIDSGCDMGTENMDLAVPAVGPDAERVARQGRVLVRNGFDKRQVPLYHAVFAHPRSVIARRADASLILAVARHDPSMRVIVSAKAYELEGSGIERIEAYMERVGITPLHGSRLVDYARSDEWEAIRVLYGQHESNDSRVFSGQHLAYMVVGSQLAGTATLMRRRGLGGFDSGDEIIAAGSHFGAIVGAMLVSDTAFAVARLAGRDGSGRDTQAGAQNAAASAGERDGVRITPEADLLRNAAEIEFDTSCGKMTGAEIAARSGRIAILQCADSVSERLAAAVARSKWFGRPGTLYVACGGDRHFALVSLLGTAGGGRNGRADPGGPLSPDRIFRVLALSKIPDSERRKIMLPAGTAITLADEIGKCGDPIRAGIAGGNYGRWMTRMDLFLAALELESTDMLRALAGSAQGIEWSGDLHIRDILDDAIAAEGALCGSGSGRGTGPPSGYVEDLPLDSIDADQKLLAQAKKWITVQPTGTRALALRSTTAAEIGARAEGVAYHTNMGMLSAGDIVEAAAATNRDAVENVRAYNWRNDGRRRLAVDIVVYDRDAPGLAASMPSVDGRHAVAVVETVDDALELGCAVVAAGYRCRIGGDRCDETRYIMGFAKKSAELDDAGALYHASYDWERCPAIWHGMLAVRNPALKNMLVATLGHSRFERSDMQAIGTIVERYLWLDGQGGTADSAGCGAAAGSADARSSGTDSTAPGRVPGAGKKR